MVKWISSSATMEGTSKAQNITEIDHDHWRSVLKAELDGVFYCVKHVLPHMRHALHGRIIAIGRDRGIAGTGTRRSITIFGKSGR